MHDTVLLFQAKKAAFVTCEELPELYEREDIADQALNEHDFAVDSTRWDDPDVNWSSFDVIILRTTWDYHIKFEKFRSWLELIAATGVPMFNSLNVIRWNFHKKYLLELEEIGIPLPGTAFFSERLSDFPDLRALMNSRKWEQVVVKPCISAGGYKTTLVKAIGDVETGQQDLETLLQERDAMVQEFIPEVTTKGEMSLVFLGRVFSHAVIKVPSGDFRVQYGCPVLPYEPTETVKTIAQAAVNQVQGDLLYARVDMVERDTNGVVLMEFEAIEPQLFLRQHPDAPENFAKALHELYLSKFKT